MTSLRISSHMPTETVRAKSTVTLAIGTRCGTRTYANCRMTPRLQEYLDAIRGLYDRQGRCPMRDIGAAVGVTSSATINDAIQRLVAMGHLRRVMRGSISYYEPTESDEGTREDLYSELRRLETAETLPASLAKFRTLWGVAQ